MGALLQLERFDLGAEKPAPPPVFAQSDQEAVGCIKALQLAGIRVPEDVLVVGVDNAPYCEFVRTPITSVSQRLLERGENAVELLVKLINGGQAASVDYEPLVVARAVLDPMEAELPDLGNAIDEAGKIDKVALLEGLAAKPKNILSIPKISYFANQARESISKFIDAWLSETI